MDLMTARQLIFVCLLTVKNSVVVLLSIKSLSSQFFYFIFYFISCIILERRRFDSILILFDNYQQPNTQKS
jgi:hypothetical protein